MDWPGAEEIGSRLASMLPPHLLDKKLDQLPPEAKALVSSLMQQMQQLKQEHDKAVAMLGDKEKDREIDRADVMNDRVQIQKDFEAKMAKIQEDLIVKMAAIEQKAEQAANKDDPSIKYHMDMTKLAADFEAKIMKIIADNEVKMDQLEAKTAIDMEKSKREDKAQDKGLRRQDDLSKFEKIHEKLAGKVDELDARMKDMQDIEIHFDRDPKTNRIAKARRVKRTVQ
jgi:hypothetical protein